MAAKFILVLAICTLSLTGVNPAYSPENDTMYNYDGYIVPTQENEGPTFVQSLLPKTKIATHMALGLIARIAFYSVTAFATLSALAIGFGVMCAFTTVCFDLQMWWAGFGRSHGMRSLLTADNLIAAEEVVNRALTKFKRIQRAVTSDY